MAESDKQEEVVQSGQDVPKARPESVDAYVPEQTRQWGNFYYDPEEIEKRAEAQREYGGAGFGGAYSATGDVPWYARPDELISHLSGKFKETMMRLASANVVTADEVTPRDMLDQYYGKNTQKEIESARYRDAYMRGYTGVEPSYKMNYANIDRPVKVYVGIEGDYYEPGKRDIMLDSPKDASDYQKGQLLKIASGNVEAAQRLKENQYTMGDLRESIRNPIAAFLNAGEHETGHSFTAAGYAPPEGAPTKSYMANPGEMANSLGRIQRETYVQYGKRFDTPGFINYLDTQVGLHPDKQFEGYSPEAKRGLKTILDSYMFDRSYQHEKTDDDKKRIWKEAAYAIPSFVQNVRKAYVQEA